MFTFPCIVIRKYVRIASVPQLFHVAVSSVELGSAQAEAFDNIYLTEVTGFP